MPRILLVHDALFRRRATIPLLACSAALLTACGAAESEVASTTVADSAAAKCTVSPSPSDDGKSDDKPVPPDGHEIVGSALYASGTTEEVLASADAVAIYRVVSRQKPKAVAGQVRNAKKSKAHATPEPSAEKFGVVRPAQLALVRSIKGSVPDCLDLDVPGGTAGKFSTRSTLFPTSFAVGDTLVAVLELATKQEVPTATSLYRAQADGTIVFPFGDRERIDLNTWNPEIKASPPPAPGAVRPPETPDDGPLAPPAATPQPPPTRAPN